MDSKPRIKITKDGPYLVTGNVPIDEKIIVSVGSHYEWKDGRELPQAESYALCRCGDSKNAPFCDSSHKYAEFYSKEFASKMSYFDRASVVRGPENGVDLFDDDRCAFARFCHADEGNVWNLIDKSDDEKLADKAIETAMACPSGRLVATKNGKVLEPELEPSITIVQDPEKGTSAGIYVKGYITIEGADGTVYEPRSRVMLCRCGQSTDMPFCDASHISSRFNDSK